MKWWQKLEQRLGSTAYSGPKQQVTTTASSDLSVFENRLFWGIENAELANNETIFSAITRLSNTMASLPIKLYQNYETLNNDVADLLTTQPNNYTTPYNFINLIETTRNEKGNAYVFIERDVYGQAVQLHLLNSDIVSMAMDKDKKDLYYIVKGNTDKKMIIHQMEILHFKHIHGASTLKGISPISVLKGTIDFDVSVREFNMKEMSTPDSFKIEYGATITDEKKAEIVENFKSFYKNNAGILFEDDGIKIDRLEKKYVSEDLIKTENITRSRVANVFQMPLAFLHGENAMSFSKTEDLNRYYLQHTIIPMCKQYEEEFNKKLLTRQDRKNGMYFKFNVHALLRGDASTQAEVYFKKVRSGINTINEIRALEDLPPVEGGDVAMISGDLYPIDTPIEERRGLASKGGGNSAEGTTEGEK
ncbi:phage portal protein [Salinicoccus sp. HZC-1]|uniref:phage portal protein n=1 Tax=Salinicoccus sp. HZC-1 TaxID=3385497 RepID=UPI00398B91D7